MQKVLRDSNSLTSFLRLPKLAMTAAFLLPNPSSSAAVYCHRRSLSLRPSLNFSGFLDFGSGHLFQRVWPPLLRQPREPCSSWIFSGNAGRGFSYSEGFRGREKRGSTEDAEEDEKCTEEIRVEADERSIRAAQPQRKQRSGSSGDTPVASVDLLSIPGVGPRNLRKLVDKGFRGVDELKQFYKDKV